MHGNPKDLKMTNNLIDQALKIASYGVGGLNIAEGDSTQGLLLINSQRQISQLEKIDMLDFADLVVINKFDRKGSDDAYRDVAKQVQRNRTAFDVMPEEMPVFGSIASKFNDDGSTS